MSRRALKINFIFLFVVSVLAWGFYFLRQQSPCNISPACRQCLQETRCLAGGDCLNKCAQKEECQNLLYCPNFENYLLKNYSGNSSIEPANAVNYATTSPVIGVETKVVPVGAGKIYEIGGEKYKIEILEICYECFDGQGRFSVKINEEVWENLKYGDHIPLSQNIELGLQEIERSSGNVVEFYFLEKEAPEKITTPWQKLLNRIKDYYHYIYERINKKINN